MPELSFRGRQIVAFAAVYIIWGSTYLAIRLLIDTLPGFSMVGLRFFIAGAILYGFARWRGEAAPSRAQWRNTSVIGIMLLFVGTGAVVWATYRIDSGLAALMVGMEPLWMALLLWLWPFGTTPGRRPDARTLGALLVGFLGAAILAAPGTDLQTGETRLLPLLVISLGCISWAAGSLWSRQADLPPSQWINTSCQMLSGGLALVVYGTAIGEWNQFQLQNVSWTSFMAFLYLVVFGSLVAFSAYSWLIRTTEPTLVATHAYVNPVVAVFLGWLIANEPVGPRTLVASALIVGSVVLLTSSEKRAAKKRATKTSTPADREPSSEVPGTLAEASEVPGTLAEASEVPGTLAEPRRLEECA